APDAAAEREEGKRIRTRTHEARGVESLRIGPDVRPAVRHVDVRPDARSGREVDAAYPSRRVEPAGDHRRDGREAHRLLDDRVEVLEPGKMLHFERPSTGHASDLPAQRLHRL